MKSKHIGMVTTEGTVAVVGSECLEALAEQLQVSVDSLKAEFGFVTVDLGPGSLGVKKMESVHENGLVYDLATIGFYPDLHKRFVEKGELSWDEFVRKRLGDPPYGDAEKIRVGREYVDYILRRTRPNDDLDEAFGIKRGEHGEISNG